MADTEDCIDYNGLSAESRIDDLRAFAAENEYDVKDRTCEGLFRKVQEAHVFAWTSIDADSSIKEMNTYLKSVAGVRDCVPDNGEKILCSGQGRTKDVIYDELLAAFTEPISFYELSPGVPMELLRDYVAQENLGLKDTKKAGLYWQIVDVRDESTLDSLSCESPMQELRDYISQQQLLDEEGELLKGRSKVALFEKITEAVENDTVFTPIKSPSKEGASGGGGLFGFKWNAAPVFRMGGKALSFSDEEE